MGVARQGCPRVLLLLLRVPGVERQAAGDAHRSHYASLQEVLENDAPREENTMKDDLLLRIALCILRPNVYYAILIWRID